MFSGCHKGTSGREGLRQSELSIKLFTVQVILFVTGGMLLVKLDSSDLQSEKMATFDGAMVYSQNKRQQVVLTEYWAKAYPEVHISCMHPGMEYGCFRYKNRARTRIACSPLISLIENSVYCVLAVASCLDKPTE